MRITFVLPCYPYRPIGGFRVVYEYANHLTARGHRVTVVHTPQVRQTRESPALSPLLIASRLRSSLRAHLRQPTVTWHQVDPRVNMRYVASLDARHIPDGDVVVATAWSTADFVARYPESKGVKFYLIQHLETWDGPKEAVERTWRLPLRKVVIARWLHETGLSLGADPAEMRHIPNGIDHAKYRFVVPFSERPRRVAMLYHPAQWKGAADGIQALEIARKEHPELQAVLFGTPRRPNGLPDWIEYRQDPPQETLVMDVYNRSRIYLCPSWAEGWHLPPAEAMACGCALVSTDIGGVRDYAEDGETALLAPPREPGALAARLCQLLEDDRHCQALGEAGNRRIREFTWEASTNALEQWMLAEVRQSRASGTRTAS